MSRPERLVVNFHGIGEPLEGVPDDELDYWCPRDEFGPLLDDLVEVRDRGAVQLQVTFDDGNLSDVEDALPALLERGLTATFFVCAGRIGERNYLDEPQLLQLRDAGMAVGSHGWSHVDLRRTDDATLARESQESRERIAAAVGAPVTRFALPFGSYDRRVLRALRGYEEVLTSDRGRASGKSWLTPRESYVRGWQPGDIARMAGARASLAQRVKRRAKRLMKSVR